MTLEILNDDQYRTITFVAAANRGGNRPTEREVDEWLHNPEPKPSRKGPIIKPGRPAKYETKGGIYGSKAFKDLFATVSSFQELQAGLATQMTSRLPVHDLLRIAGTRELVEAEVPAEYGPDIPAETFIEHLVRLRWIEKDNRNTLGVTPLGRALLRNEDANESQSETYDIVVLDSDNELSYPILVQKLAEAGDALLIDPYLRVEQLLAVKMHTSVSRILVSEKLKQEDRAAMAVLVESVSDRPLEIRMAKNGTLHDRMAIGDNLAFTIGTSMNTIGRQHPTILTPLPDEAADAMRTHAEKWWDDAQVLARYPSQHQSNDD